MPASDRVAILAAMNIADELLQLRRAAHDDMSTIERRTQSLIALLDEKLSVEGVMRRSRHGKGRVIDANDVS